MTRAVAGRTAKLAGGATEAGSRPSKVHLAGVQILATLWHLSKSLASVVVCRLAQQVTGLQMQVLQLKAGVQRELDGGGYRLAPVRSRLEQMLADFSSSAGLPAASQLQNPAQQQADGGLPQQSSSLTPAPQVCVKACCA